MLLLAIGICGLGLFGLGVCLGVRLGRRCAPASAVAVAPAPPPSPPAPSSSLPMTVVTAKHGAKFHLRDDCDGLN